MTDEEWHRFFTIAAKTLGYGRRHPRTSETWCSWTTFDRLTRDGLYWASGLPNPDDLAEMNLKDGWWQPFLYQELAHIIIPRRFYWEWTENGALESGEKAQDIAALSRRLDESSIGHRKTDLVLEIKLY